MRPNSFESEFGKRAKHKVEVRVTGGAVYLITFRNDKEGEWGQGSATRSRTVNSGFPVVQVAMHATRGIHRSEEHTSELQSLMRISYAVFCLKKKKLYNTKHN